MACLNVSSGVTLNSGGLGMLSAAGVFSFFAVFLFPILLKFGWLVGWLVGKEVKVTGFLLVFRGTKVKITL